MKLFYKVLFYITILLALVSCNDKAKDDVSYFKHFVKKELAFELSEECTTVIAVSGSACEFCERKVVEMAKKSSPISSVRYVFPVKYEGAFSGGQRLDIIITDKIKKFRLHKNGICKIRYCPKEKVLNNEYYDINNIDELVIQ